MPHPFVLQVPADGRYRSLAPEVAGKYMELIGGSADDVRGLAEALTTAMTRVAEGGAAVVDLAFERNAHGVQVTVRSGAHATVVRHAITTP